MSESEVDAVEEAIIRISKECLISSKINEEQSSKIANDIWDKFHLEFDGLILYVKRGRRKKTQKRIDKILRDFNGLNHGDLARKYNLSVGHIYKIIQDYTEMKRGKKHE